MINRIKPNAKATNFERIFFLVTVHEIANAFPILFFEHCIVVAVKSRALKASKLRMYQRFLAEGSFIKKKANLSCTSIICILNQFLLKHGDNIYMWHVLCAHFSRAVIFFIFVQIYIFYILKIMTIYQSEIHPKDLNHCN